MQRGLASHSGYKPALSELSDEYAGEKGLLQAFFAAKVAALCRGGMTEIEFAGLREAANAEARAALRALARKWRVRRDAQRSERENDKPLSPAEPMRPEACPQALSQVSPQVSPENI
jgi:hypothetical protein